MRCEVSRKAHYGMSRNELDSLTVATTTRCFQFYRTQGVLDARWVTLALNDLRFVLHAMKLTAIERSFAVGVRVSETLFDLQQPLCLKH
jgi:hypothetical protein